MAHSEGHKVTLDNVKLHYVDSFEDASKFIQWMGERTSAPIGVDTESTGFYWHSGDYVRLAQVGDADTGWAFNWERWSGMFECALRQHTGPIDMMNAKFDWSFLHKAGVTLDQRRIRDVGVAAHIREPHLSRALKNQSRRWVDPRAGAGQNELDAAFTKSGWTWATVPTDFNLYWTYAALDTVLTRRLADIHFPAIEYAARALDIETEYQWLAQKMEAHGIHVDLDYAQDHYDKFTEYCDQVEKWCWDEYQVKPGSNAKIIEILAKAGFQFSKATKSGAISLDGAVLEGIDHPLAKAVLQRRRLQKLASTYLRYYLGHADPEGFIHPSINTLGTRTSRCSMDNPNLQNLPRKSDTNPAAQVVRNCMAARPGYTMLTCDFDQIEMRGLAIMSRDPGLIAAFNSPEDFFVNLARVVYRDPFIQKSDERRRVTKNVGYAKIYGAGVAKMAITAGIPEDQARSANSSFDQSYPEVRGFLKQVFDEAMARKQTDGFAWTDCPLTGRRHPAEPGKEYALPNYKIQGWAAALFKSKQLELQAAGLGEYMVVPVHDEIVMEVPDEDVRDAVRTLQQVMNDDQLFPVPITASVAYGKRWGEKKDWSDE